MKSTFAARATRKSQDDLRPEYRFDYSKAKPNRFARRDQPKSVAVILDPDVAKVFKDEESVNAALRAILTAIPGKSKR